MKKLIAIFIFMQILNIGYCQTVERETKIFLNVSEPRSELKKIEKWKLSYDNKWEIEKSIFDMERLELREIEINNDVLSILVIKYRTINYQYPHIKEGYYETYDLFFYVFKISGLDSINTNFKDFNKAYIVNFDFKYSGLISDYKYKDLSKEIALKIQHSVEVPSYQKFQILFFPVIYEKEKRMRFILNQYVEGRNNKNIIDFDKEYFEVSFEKFNQFINYKK